MRRDGGPLCASVAPVTGRSKRHDRLLYFFFVDIVLCWLVSGCLSLHRCGEAPIPAALVSSLLPLMIVSLINCVKVHTAVLPLFQMVFLYCWHPVHTQITF